MSSTQSSNLREQADDQASIAVIIPSRAGEIGELLQTIVSQTWRPDEVITAIGVSPNGRSRNTAVNQTQCDVLVFIDDDAFLGNNDAIEQLVKPLLTEPAIHITGAAKLIPPNSSWFQRWVAREIPRIEHPVVSQAIETNPDPPHFSTELTTTCCAMRRDDFLACGAFDETLRRGVDTEFFVRARRAGYRFILVPNTWAWHPAPAGLRALWRKHFLYGYGHAQEIAQDPQRAQGLQKRPWLYFLYRTLLLIPNIFIPYSYAAPQWRFDFKPLKAVTSYVSAVGFVYGAHQQAKNIK